MGKKNYVAELKQYAVRTNSTLKFEPVSSDDRTKRFWIKAVVNGQSFPNGVGNSKNTAKQKAAKSVLRCLKEKENLVDENATENPAATAHKRVPINHKGLLIESGQLNKVSIRAVESTRPEPNNATQCCSFVGGNAATGKTKMEDKEEAPMLAFQDRCSNFVMKTQNAAENPATTAHKSVKINHESFLNESGQLNKVPIRAVESTRQEPNNATQLAVLWEDQVDSSREDVMNPEGVDAGTRPSNETQPGSIQSGISRFIQDFDSIEKLGKGGFGCVFKAKEKLTGKYFAVKIVVWEENRKALREVQALSDLHHSNVVRYFCCWMEDSGYQWDSASDSYSPTQSSVGDASIKYLYIQMELCDTKTLVKWIEENVQSVKKSLRDSKSREASLRIAQQIVNGVKYIHSKMLIHRDLKPANIMFGPDGQVKIGDFGLVTAENDDDGENLLERTVYKGTPSYMAPEQRSQNTYDRKVDIFAVGLIYIELLWKFPTLHEKQMVWDNIRKQIFPEGFCHNFTEEYFIIKPMLSAKPEDRPEASQLKKEIQNYISKLSPKENHRGGIKSV